MLRSATQRSGDGGPSDLTNSGLEGFSDFETILTTYLRQLQVDLLAGCEEIAQQRESAFLTTIAALQSDNVLLQRELRDAKHNGESETEVVKHQESDRVSSLPSYPALRRWSSVENLSQPAAWSTWKEWEQKQVIAGGPGIENISTIREWETHSEGPSDGGIKSRVLIMPASNKWLVWEVLGIPALAWDLITIPLFVFDLERTKFWQVMSWITLIYWTGDIIFTFFVPYHHPDGTLEMSLSKIAMKYMRGRFLLDCAIVVPDWLSAGMALSTAASTEWLDSVGIFRIFRIGKVAKLVRLTQLRSKFRTVQDRINSEYISVLMNIAVMLTSLMLGCHYICCLWFSLGIQDSDSWVQVENFSDVGWPYQYVTAFHWALTQFTPGSMAVQPHNFNERVMAIGVLVAGTVFFSLFISALTQERMRLHQITSKLSRDSWLLRRYMRQRGVSHSLSLRIVRYVDGYISRKMKRLQQEDVALLKRLSDPLQTELQAEVNHHILSRHPLFNHLRQSSLSVTARIYSRTLRESPLAQRDILFEAGQVAHEMIFVAAGRLEYKCSYQNCEVAAKEWCCEAILWTAWVHKGVARAVTETEIIFIESVGFRKVILQLMSGGGFVSTYARLFVAELNRLSIEGCLVNDCHHDIVSESMALEAINQFHDHVVSSSASR
mmetsp:Transcript_2156/g.4971  ORF Transcript_2156/g.4971 Transcript_2156/m.4971 type:complete len:664 (-) Transcript_2156:51-2042(-)